MPPWLLTGCGNCEPLQRAAFFIAVAQWTEDDYDALTGFYGISAPAAGANEVARAGHLHQPDRRPLAILFLDCAIDRETDVRIKPAQFHDGAFDRERLCVIEHRRGMVRRHGRNAGREGVNSEDGNC